MSFNELQKNRTFEKDVLNILEGLKNSLEILMRKKEKSKEEEDLIQSMKEDISQLELVLGYAEDHMSEPELVNLNDSLEKIFQLVSKFKNKFSVIIVEKSRIKNIQELEMGNRDYDKVAKIDDSTVAIMIPEISHSLELLGITQRWKSQSILSQEALIETVVFDPEDTENSFSEKDVIDEEKSTEKFMLYRVKLLLRQRARQLVAKYSK